MAVKILLRRIRNFRLRTQLLLLMLPLAIAAVVVVGASVGYIASRQAYLGVEQAAQDDLDHMAHFTLDLFDAHYRQFEVYREDKKKTVQGDLAALVKVASELVAAEEEQSRRGKLLVAEAKQRAVRMLKEVSVGESGYLYAMTSRGKLVAHVAIEGQSIYDERDEGGRYFIREMCRNALAAAPGTVQHIIYPWKNPALGDKVAREKTVAYLYFQPWDWIVAAGGYLDETYDAVEVERSAFHILKERVKAKKVGTTGYIYALDGDGRAVIHPFREGQDLLDEKDDGGRPFIREMVETKSGWIRYPWKNVTDPVPRMKIVRYLHFEPWNWIVAVGSYENEFLHDAEEIKGAVALTTIVLVCLIALGASLLVFAASRAFTEPILKMTDVIRRVRGGALDEKMPVGGADELVELADAYNRMGEKLRDHRELENNLAQQGKMASLGVLSSGIAHEINNPLGVILGYAAYLENKLAPDDPNLPYIQEIRRESKRSKKIVQDLLSYARAPRPDLQPIDLNGLLEQIVDFAVNHTELACVEVEKRYEPDLPSIEGDGDQLRQVAMNLLLNAGAAMPEGGRLTVATRNAGTGHVEMIFSDTGAGMPEEVVERMFEPFFTTKAQGIGLGLSITRQIIERHQGLILVKSSPGGGTTVTVRLPVCREEF